MANTKITTGADATIVAAATRAGLAAAPPDYSGTFEDVSRVYGETVKSSAEAFKSIANATALIGGELAKNAAEWNSAVQKVYDAGGTENVVNEIYALKDELRDLGPLSGVFGNRETRKKRMEILTRKNKLFSEIDKWGEALDNAAVAVESNNLDYNLMGLEKEETLNAIIASNTNNKITVAGHYARITKDDNGGLSYTIYNEDGSEATYSDGTTRTISLRDFQSLLTENVADKENVYGNAMNELSTSAENLGVTYGGEYTEYHSGKMRGALNNMTNTANDRRRLMRTAFGIDNKSFYEHITEGEENVETAGLWTLMMKDLAAGEVKGELAVTTGQRGELLANIEDTDGSKGISKEEIENQWMAFTGSLLSGESDFSKQAIIDYADKKFKTNFEFGARQKALANKNNKDDSGKNLKYGGYAYTSDSGGDSVSGQDAFTNIPYSDKIARRSALLNLEEVPGVHFTYRYTEDDGWFAIDKKTNKFVRNLKGSDIARIEGLFNTNDANNERAFSYFNAKTTKKRKENTPPAGSQGFSVSSLKVRNAGDFKQSVLNIFKPEILDDYLFEDVVRITEFGSDKVQDQVRIKSKDGSFDKIFNIGKKANDELAKELNNLFSDYLAVDPFIIEEKQQ